jgi:hypothetical protein
LKYRVAPATVKGVASDRVSISEKPAGTAEEVLVALLDLTGHWLTPERADEFGVPTDELHREILLPLLPAMITDRAIRHHWREQRASGFFARLLAHLEMDAPQPMWEPADFEIHVTASYSAGADAKALADTLLSEESLRDLAAAMMNRMLEVAWPELPTRRAATEPAVESARIVPEVVESAELPAEHVVIGSEEAGPWFEEQTTEEPAVVFDAVASAEPVADTALVPTPVVALPAQSFRPKLPNYRQNPIAGRIDARSFRFNDWLAVNPLARRFRGPSRI